MVEEVAVDKEVTEHTETVRGAERHTEVDVQREPETATQTRRVPVPQDFATYNEDFRKHYVTAFGNSGVAYAEYEPAYRYGYELGTHERYRGRDWAALEAEALLGGPASEHLGALQRGHSLWLGQSPRPDSDRASASARAARGHAPRLTLASHAPPLPRVREGAGAA